MKSKDRIVTIWGYMLGGYWPFSNNHKDADDKQVFERRIGDRVKIVTGLHAGHYGVVAGGGVRKPADYPGEWSECYEVDLDFVGPVDVRCDQIESSQ